MISLKKIDEHEIIDFCEFWFDFKPHEYQKKFLLACVKNKRIAALWFRQGGKSTCVSMFVAYWALTHPKHQIIIVSPTQRQSSELFSKIRNLLESNDITREFLKQSTATQIMMKNGSRIVSLPVGHDGGTIRGFTGDILIEEEAQGIKDEVDASVLSPIIASKQNAKRIKIGTPKLKNHFYRSCYGKNSPYELIHVPYTEGIKAGQITQSFIDEERENFTSTQFTNEYLAQFIDDSDSFFPSVLIESCLDVYPMIERLI